MKRKKEPGLVLSNKDKPLLTRMYKYRYMYVMYLPVFLVFLVFNYIPMVGVLLAFTKYYPISQ